MSLPATLSDGYLLPGIHKAALDEITQRFGISTSRRQVLADRLRELLHVVQATGQLRRVFIWGSFVTAKPFPRDLDVFLLMKAGFDTVLANLPPEQRQAFDHERAQLVFEADVFWATEAIGEEELTSWLEVYQFSRDMSQRGIVEVMIDD